ncbi:MAG: hypothetical protein JJT75_05130 [Opitutales bacterium]|nr:hypothetical protein [Opitutales bacterium]MCH8540278.1 hypothetical protein [Opitutales bacterium]
MKPAVYFSGVIVAIVLALVVVILLFLRSGPTGSSHDPMPVVRYLNDPPLSHHGNRYTLEAVIHRQLDAQNDVGRLISVEVPQNDVRVPLLIPPSLDDSLYVGQRYIFEIHVQEDRLVVESMKRN